MDFKESEKINVVKHMEKKGRFSYLSWPFAVSELRKNYPEAIWEVETYGENNQPYCVSDSGCFVSVTVFLWSKNGKAGYTQVHPVLNHQNKTVKDPDAFMVNTSIQRCLVKAIALATGIGLHIYAGEDLPPDGDEKHPNPKKQQNFETAENYNALSIAMQENTNKERLDKWCAFHKDQTSKLPPNDRNRLNATYSMMLDMFKDKEESKDKEASK